MTEQGFKSNPLTIQSVFFPLKVNNNNKDNDCDEKVKFQLEVSQIKDVMFFSTKFMDPLSLKTFFLITYN